MNRDTTRRNILNPVGRTKAQNILSNDLYSKRKIRNDTGAFAQRERLLIQYADKYYPIKKYAVDLSEMTEANKTHITENKNWVLKITGLYRRFTEQIATQIGKPQQEFCLIITIRDPSGKNNVYTETIQKLDAHQFWHNSINISNRIMIETY